VTPPNPPVFSFRLPIVFSVPLPITSRRNWLFVGGDGGLSTAAVLLSVCASAKRHGLNEWSYLRNLFERLPAVPAGADLSEFLPDAWAKSHLSP
jgi:hypothetical protein